ncbi:MAG: ATPase [Deltaproteobacteria bacterium]|nr:MAG: ATPase [Deltaproteobacteria bacterium]
MSNHPTLLQQFRSFCYQNNATDLEQAIEYFAVFGGMGWTVDFSKSIDELIETKVLNNYRYIHGDLTKITHSKPMYHAMLSAIAIGDRREYSAFKKVNIGREQGEEIIDFLIKDGFLIFDKSVEKPVNEKDGISDKLLFVAPFMRFWFGVISPTYKSIKEGDYKEVKTRWSHMKADFSTLIYDQLILEMLKQGFKDAFEGDPIVAIGGYWDKNVEIDILIKRKSGELIAGASKYSKVKANKSELTKLKEKCSQAELDVDTFVIFSKNKFSSELKKEKGDNLQLFSLRNLTGLVAELNEKDLLSYTNKKY